MLRHPHHMRFPSRFFGPPIVVHGSISAYLLQDYMYTQYPRLILPSLHTVTETCGLVLHSHDNPSMNQSATPKKKNMCVCCLADINKGEGRKSVISFPGFVLFCLARLQFILLHCVIIIRSGPALFFTDSHLLFPHTAHCRHALDCQEWYLLSPS